MLKGFLICAVGVLTSVHLLEGHQAEADEIELSFCYIDNEWAKPNTTIYAKDRNEADKKAKKKGLMFCKQGPCTFDGKQNPTDENCTW